MTTSIVDLPEESRQLLISMHGGFLHGMCYEFAIGMSRKIDWPIVGLINHDAPKAVQIEHVGLKTPDGLIHDIRGPLDEEKFSEPFRTGSRYTIEIVSIQDLYDSRRINKKEISERDVKCAEHICEIIWPALPWRESCVEKLKSFLDEVEALSRKYGLWIRAPFPGVQPVIGTQFGDEDGYIARSTEEGNAFTFDRKLDK
jgi:hypothetical protein